MEGACACEEEAIDVKATLSEAGDSHHRVCPPPSESILQRHSF
jgi:hypothetical protein